jgi:hypothetical protein
MGSYLFNAEGLDVAGHQPGKGASQLTRQFMTGRPGAQL